MRSSLEQLGKEQEQARSLGGQEQDEASSPGGQDQKQTMSPGDQEQEQARSPGDQKQEEARSPRAQDKGLVEGALEELDWCLQQVSYQINNVQMHDCKRDSS